MRRRTTLSPSHYAGKWEIPERDQRYDLDQVNLLGYNYATAPDGPEKEQKLLLVLECFHGYLMKYLCMIVRGTIPPANTYAGKDSAELLRTLSPKGSKYTRQIAESTCKTLHLSFKQHTTEEIYDTLVFCFMKAARKYDPYYADKTRRVCEVISEAKESFTALEIESRVGFDCLNILRALVKRGYLASLLGGKKVIGYRKGHKWPAPPSFFESGPIGFVYMLQIWFRYYFKEHIEARLSELEASDKLFQLGHAGVGSSDYDPTAGFEPVMHHAEGNCLSTNGSFRYMADRSLMDMPLDISELNLSWVSSTGDKLFRELTVQQRTILYLHFYEEQSFRTMAKTLGVDPQIVQRLFNDTLNQVRYQADLPE